MTVPSATEEGPYMADLLDALGGISPRRVLLKPTPGTATEEDLLQHMRRTDRQCELVDGTLVEKTMGYLEGSLATWISHLIQGFLDDNDLGNVAGSDGTMRLMPKLVRIPDVSFVRWEKLPGRAIPTKAIPDLVPDLAIEVLSKGNTRGEMLRKLKEYFLVSTTLVWMVDPVKRRVTVHTSPDIKTVFGEDATLDGGDVLPGFALPVKRIFERLPASPPRRRPRRDK